MNRCIGYIVFFSMSLAATADLSVSNLVVLQRSGSKVVDISYDLVYSGTHTLTTALVISNGTTEIDILTVTGDLGYGVLPGLDKVVTWDAGQDGELSSLLEFTISASYDGPADADPTAIDWEVVNERWIRNFYLDGSITVNDKDNGLMWVYDADLFGTSNWDGAMSICSALNYAGYQNWELPHYGQLQTLVNGGRIGLKDLVYDGYWSSSYATSDKRWLVKILDPSQQLYLAHVEGSYWVLPCRSFDRSPSFSRVVKATSSLIETDARNSLLPITGLVAFYSFSGNAEDTSGNGNDGTVEGAALKHDRYGNPNSAYQFDGVDDRIVILDNEDFTVSDVTISAWVLTTNKSDYKHIISCYGTNTVDQWYNLYLNSGSGMPQWQVDPGSGSPPIATGTTDLADGAWHHVVGVRDTKNSLLRVYVDGVLEGTCSSISTNFLNPSTDFWIGGQAAWSSRYFDGTIDDVRIYNRVLVENEIYQLSDSDLDQLSDFDENNIHGSNPLVSDSDGDGLPDGWEVFNELNIATNDSGHDADNDGLSNLQEFILGTNPRDSQSYSILSTVPVSGFNLQCATLFGRQYLVEYKDSLNEVSWLPFTNFAGSGDLVLLIDEDIFSNRFFRVNVVNP